MSCALAIGELELQAAVAARRAEDVAGQALAVDPDQDRFVAGEIAQQYTTHEYWNCQYQRVANCT